MNTAKDIIQKLVEEMPETKADEIIDFLLFLKERKDQELYLGIKEEEELWNIINNDERVSSEKVKELLEGEWMRRIEYTKTAYKSLCEYGKDTWKRIIEAIDKIPQGDIKKLQGEKYPPLYRLRVGKYRIVYRIENEEIIIAKIDTRGDIYK